MTTLSVTEAIYPATRTTDLSQDEITASWAVQLIEGGSDAVYYAEKYNEVGKAPEIKKSYRVSRKSVGSMDQLVTAHASHKFFEKVAQWWPKAQEAINSH